LRITLIGMSGSGKSHWSRALAATTFKRFACDDLIAAKLFPHLAGLNSAVQFLGEWMGFPHSSGYAERESRYLQTEIEVLHEIVAFLNANPPHAQEKVVIDTTGSVIYSGEDILHELCRLTTVVHLPIPPQIRQTMLKTYLQNPRPVLWRGFYSRNQGETGEQAMSRCYPLLLAAREELYSRYAHRSIDYFRRNDPNFGVNELLRGIAEMRLEPNGTHEAI
jgi:hypothetical protein